MRGRGASTTSGRGAGRGAVLVPALALLVAVLFAAPARAYVPARPTNDTSFLDTTDASRLTIRCSSPWKEYSGVVSYQLRADEWISDTTQGALVHFTEASLNASDAINVTTPWIAYISCDANETGASDFWDIFTLARDHGAVSALLYSENSEACVLEEEYIADFEKPLSVFATTSKAVAGGFDAQWKQTTSLFEVFNSTLLNSAAADVNVTLAGQQLDHKSYLGAIMTSRNGTAQAAPRISSSESSDSGSGGGGGGKSSGMIAVYVISGFLAAMVCLTIISVIRRSMRIANGNGGAYIPRGDGAEPQERRRVGLTQAIVDTFPVQKFYKSKPLQSDSELAFELPQLPPAKRLDSSSMLGESSQTPLTGSNRTSADGLDAGVPSDDHCPICLLEFETGDDLRVLPCTGQHRFHQVCVDPWLLRVSTSCPLCRKDFNPDLDEVDSSDDEGTQQTSASAHRVTSRYLALISRARRRNRPRADSSASELISRRPLRPREADQNGPGGY